MQIDYFYKLTPRQFFNIQKGWSDKRDAESKERMVYVRRLMFAVWAVYDKNITEQKIWPFDWEGDSLKEYSEQEQQDIAKALEATKKRWEERDKKRQVMAKTDSK